MSDRDDQSMPSGHIVTGDAGGREDQVHPVAMKLKLDLHDVYNRGRDIDRSVRAVIDEAVRIKVKTVEIIPGKGSGALKRHVLRWLDQKQIKALDHRVEKDSDNFGRAFVHFTCRYHRRP